MDINQYKYLLIICLISFVILCVSFWKIFKVKRYAGWKSLVPVYNIIVLLKITGNKTSYLFLLLLPIVNMVIILIILMDLAKVFDKSKAFTAGLIFLPIIFIPVLAFKNPGGNIN
ncbi:MAG: hypothetical protein Kow0068_19510 [Marinilabiliales bacterium]